MKGVWGVKNLIGFATPTVCTIWILTTDLADSGVHFPLFNDLFFHCRDDLIERFLSKWLLGHGLVLRTSLEPFFFRATLPRAGFCDIFLLAACFPTTGAGIFSSRILLGSGRFWRLDAG